MVGVRMGHDQPRNFHVRQRALQQRGPGGDRFFVAEAGIHHRPAVSVGEQVDINVIEAERQLQPNPQYAGHDLHDLIRAGMIFPGVTQCFHRGLSSGCF